MDLMKIAYEVNSSTVRIVSKELRKAQQNLSRTPFGDNYGKHFDSLYSVRELARLREGTRRDARHLHLARAFLKGTPYRMVEETTREGNKPDAETIREILADYDMFYYEEYLSFWLEEEKEAA